jgi:hypothetical protein
MGWANGQNFVWCFDEEGSRGTNPPPVWTNCYPCEEGNYNGSSKGTYPTPAVADGEVYTDDNNSLLNCYSAATGALLWSNTNFYGRAATPVWGASPLIEGDLEVVNPGGHNGAAAISRTTHNVVWPAGAGPGGGYASPQAATIEGKRIIIGYGDNITGLDPATGNILWYYPYFSNVNGINLTTPIMLGSTKLFISEGYSDGLCVEIDLAGASGLVTNVVWPRNGNIETWGNTGVAYSNYMYGVDQRGELRCLDLSNGSLKWKQSGFSCDGSVLSAGDQLIALTGGPKSDVVIAQASPDGYNELHRLTNGVTYSGIAVTYLVPTLCNGKLYVRSPDGTLVCYQVGYPPGRTGIVQFATSACSVPENGGSVTFNVCVTNGSSGPVTVDFATAGGTAVAGVNYVATNGTLTYVYGETSKTFTVSVVDDGVWQTNNYTVNLGLSNITGSAVFGSPTNAVLTILDVDGPGSFQFSSSGYAVSQDAGTMNIQVIRMNGKTGMATVDYATSDGTAAADQNYTATSGTLSFASGETSKTFSVTVLNQPVGGSGKTVNLTLSSPTAGATVGSPGTAVLKIVPPGPFSVWPHKMNIQFPGYTSAQTLTNFPVLLVFSNNMGGGFSYNQALPAGADLRFSDSTNAVALNFEIEKWVTNGASYVWVQVPVLSNNCGVWAFWGKSDATPAPCTTNGATWNSDFRGVWHLGEVNGAASHFDSTANGNNATTNGTTSMGIAGVVDGAAAYTGSDIGRITNMNNSLTVTGKVLTVGIWVQPTAALNQVAKVGFLGKLQESGGNGSDYGLFYDWTTVHFAGGGTDFGAGYDIPINTWTYLVGVCDGSYLRLYVNGVQYTSTACSGNTPNNYSVLIGGGYWGGKLNGKLDEGRIMAAAASSNWIWTSYMNMASNSTFCSYTNNASASGNAAMGTPISWLNDHGLSGDYNAQELADPDGDGVPTWQEYIMGTDPTSSSSALKAMIQHPHSGGIVISFQSLSASGTDYTGKQRFYTLESATNLISPNWQAVLNYSNLLGNDALDIYTNANLVMNSVFYRVRTHLQ